MNGYGFMQRKYMNGDVFQTLVASPFPILPYIRYNPIKPSVFHMCLCKEKNKNDSEAICKSPWFIPNSEKLQIK
jgi:hypothetical protein